MSLEGRSPPGVRAGRVGRFGEHERASKLRFRISLTRSGTLHAKLSARRFLFRNQHRHRQCRLRNKS